MHIQMQCEAGFLQDLLVRKLEIKIEAQISQR